jgi:hypothetical protein
MEDHAVTDMKILADAFYMHAQRIQARLRPYVDMSFANWKIEVDTNTIPNRNLTGRRFENTENTDKPE